MRIALVGDIHHYRLLVPPWRLIGKRLLGQSNLWLHRRHSFNRELLEPVLQRVADTKPDLLLFAGDLTTTSYEKEFQDVAQLLKPVTRDIPTVAVPGNHDRYTPAAARFKRFERYLTTIAPARYPHTRQLNDRWQLLALNAAVPRIISARGELGRRQLHDVREQVQHLTPSDGLVVLCHYPIKLPPSAAMVSWNHKLNDWRRLRRILANCRARVLYLHGHIHKPWLWLPRKSQHAHFTYINAGSPTLTDPRRYPHGQGFWLIELPNGPDQPLRAIHHVPAADPDTHPAVLAAEENWLTRHVL